MNRGDAATRVIVVLSIVALIGLLAWGATTFSPSAPSERTADVMVNASCAGEKCNHSLTIKMQVENETPKALDLKVLTQRLGHVDVRWAEPLCISVKFTISTDAGPGQSADLRACDKGRYNVTLVARA